MKNEECLICKAPLEYLETGELMECAICHKKEISKTRCINGHYVCNECHTEGMDAIIGVCLGESSKDPVDILEKMIHTKTADYLNEMQCFGLDKKEIISIIKGFRYS